MNVSHNKKLSFSKPFIYLAGIIVSFLVAEMLSSTKLFQQFESKTVDFRFRLRGQQATSSELALVLIDEPSRQVIGDAPYPREIFVTLAYGLTALGAKAIGMDFRFEGHRNPATDSLLVEMTRQIRHLVHGYYFRRLYDQIDYATEDSLTRALQKHSIPIPQEEAISYYQADEVILPFPELRQVSQHLGHINILIDETSGSTQKLPLLISYHHQYYPAFSLEMLKAFWNLSAQEIELKSNKIVLHPPDRSPVTVPLTDKGEFVINYLGDQDVFENTFSFIDVFPTCQQLISGDLDSIQDSVFRDKLVLIGSLVDQDQFETPFSVQFPGVLIHATVIDNILQGRYVTELKSAHLIYLLLGGILFLIFSQLKPGYQLPASLALLFLYGLGVYLSFCFGAVIIPMLPPVFFMILSMFSIGLYEYATTAKTNALLHQLIKEQSQKLEEFAQTVQPISSEKLYLKLFIPFIELREQCLFPHRLEMKGRYWSEPAPFETRWRAKNPLPVDLNEIRKLNHHIKKLGEDYARYVVKGEKCQPRPIDKLRKIGEQITANFGLKTTFRELFSLSSGHLPLNLVVDDLRIPWHWAFDSQQNRFLCEQFAVGISFAVEKDLESKSVSRQTEAFVMPTGPKCAILFYGDWKGHPTKELKQVASAMNALQKKISRTGNTINLIYEDVWDFLNCLEQCMATGTNLRLIHYTGHGEGDYLDVSEACCLKPGMMSESKGLYFASRPLVFLNACRAGQLPLVWEKYEHLATEFLACGAAACVATSFDIHETTAITFSLKFYEHFIEEGLPAGQALRCTIVELGQCDTRETYDPDFDLTRYFYCLYGDPTVKF